LGKNHCKTRQLLGFSAFQGQQSDAIFYHKGVIIFQGTTTPRAHSNAWKQKKFNKKSFGRNTKKNKKKKAH